MNGSSSPRSIQEIDFTPHGTVFPSPEDWRDHFIYFLLVDRFDDNKKHKRYDGSRRDGPRDYVVGRGVQGGKLAGVTRRLDYIKGLGATAIWLSPVFKNKIDSTGTYHGYAIQDFLDVDPHIGTKEDLKELVQKAHELGMYVILDIVVNHTGDTWGYVNESYPTYNHDGTRYPFGFWRANHKQREFSQDDAVWPAELQNPDAFKRRGSIVDWNNEDELVNGDIFNLKALELSDPSVLEVMTAVYKYWIVEADIDGYRIDTAKHVGIDPAIKFFNGIKEYASSIGKKNFFLFGEIIAGDDTITKYVGRQSTSGESLRALDAALDFPLYFVLEEVIKGFASPALLRERVARLHALYPAADASSCTVTFLDNHDQMARPYKRFLNGVPDKTQVVLGIAYLLTGLGIPSIYYGTEQAFDGGGQGSDYYIRECMFGGKWGAFGVDHMHFFDDAHPLYVAISKIAGVRQKEPALRYGRMYFRDVSENGSEFKPPALGWGMLAYSRILDSTEVIVVLNLRHDTYTNHIEVDRSLTPPGSSVIDLVGTAEALVEERAGRSSMQVTLPPYGIAILKQKPPEQNNT